MLDQCPKDVEELSDNDVKKCTIVVGKVIGRKFDEKTKEMIYFVNLFMDTGMRAAVADFYPNHIEAFLEEEEKDNKDNKTKTAKKKKSPKKAKKSDITAVPYNSYDLKEEPEPWDGDLMEGCPDDYEDESEYRLDRCVLESELANVRKCIPEVGEERVTT